jgi:hypothetical protein
LLRLLQLLRRPRRRRGVNRALLRRPWGRLLLLRLPLGLIRNRTFGRRALRRIPGRRNGRRTLRLRIRHRRAAVAVPWWRIV